MINFDFQKTDSFGVFLFIFLRFLIIFSLSLRYTLSSLRTTRGGIFYLSSLCFLKIFNFPSTRSGRAGPLLSAPAESRQRQAQGSFTPLRIPGPKWGAGRPPLETPKSSLARQIWPNSSPLRGWSFGAVGESRERVRARHGRRASPLRFWGLRPLARCRSPLGKSANAHGTAADKAFAATRSQISRKLLPRKRLGVPSLPSRELGAEGRASAPRGNPKGAQPLCASLCLLSAGQKVGARAASARSSVEGKSASKEKEKNLREGKEEKEKIFREKQKRKKGAKGAP